MMKCGVCGIEIQPEYIHTCNCNKRNKSSWIPVNPCNGCEVKNTGGLFKPDLGKKIGCWCGLKEKYDEAIIIIKSVLDYLVSYCDEYGDVISINKINKMIEELKE